ncbi:MAG: DUF4914 family protein [Spirochaetes bacterium]|nr:DUF4914 family protein [Spirochaetota bacterium]
MKNDSRLKNIMLPAHIADMFARSPEVLIAGSADEIASHVCPSAGGKFAVSYDVPGKGVITEATVCMAKNGFVANYEEEYMRRRDPACMLIGDDLPTDKDRFSGRFAFDFASVKKDTFAWMTDQRLLAFMFWAGGEAIRIPALAIVPANAAFFAYGLSLLQGCFDPSALPSPVSPRAIMYVAPTLRHTHFGGKQIVVHARGDVHEVFSFNLYPGPSAKKGVYGVLLTIGEKEQWITAHASAVRVVTPYDNRTVIMHEGASGGGKSEMLEHVHRQDDGSLLVGTNTVSGETMSIVLPKTCELKPIADDMALCHPSFQRDNGKLYIRDAEHGWFIRVNHITNYGTDPDIESRSIHPSERLLFLNIDASPGSTALLWEHIEDAPGKPCPNPRFIFPRSSMPGTIEGACGVDIRSFGVRTPPSTAASPGYGILGLIQVLPPALAWLWRLVSPRGYDNPSIVADSGIGSEGVGSYWPFATGLRCDQANLLLEQIVRTPRVRYILTPNQHIGAWRVGFMPQWIMREYFARRGSHGFSRNEIHPSPCPLLGYEMNRIVVEGQAIEPFLLHTRLQPEMGDAGFAAGAAVLTAFFREELAHYAAGLSPLGKRIIACCLQNGGIADYESLIPSDGFWHEDDGDDTVAAR